MAPHLTITLLLLLLPLFSSSDQQIYSIADHGATPNSGEDSAPHLLNAWKNACRSPTPAAVLIPSGKFLVSHAVLQGPCRSNRVSVNIKGTIIAPSTYTYRDYWIMFKNVNGLTISGGLLDGRGRALWSCKRGGGRCPYGSTSLYIAYSDNVRLNRVSSVNSEKFHIAIYRSSNVRVAGAAILAPFDSPNTDGIHIEESRDVVVRGCRIRTGDDCISMGPGGRNVWIENVRCGPGHGISIGSLGSAGQQHGVRNVTAKNIRFTGTQNGFRIKTWAKPNSGFAREIVFQNASMKNVANPIIIDQNYCPGDRNCPTQSSGIQISDVTVRDVVGTSATAAAVKLDCSKSKPCKGIVLKNIKLDYNGGSEIKMLCSNVNGESSGVVIPPSCFVKMASLCVTN